MTARLTIVRTQPLEPIRAEPKYAAPGVCIICMVLTGIGLWWIGWVFARLMWGAL